jgi:outer membrane immunogenic protein
VVLVSLPAVAADVPRGSLDIAPQSAAYNWHRAYVGLNGGYTWGNVGSLPLSPSGFVGGAQAGYAWEVYPFILGAETDVQFSGATDRFAAYQFANPWFGTLRGRVGIAFSNVLLYATAGLAYGAGQLTMFRFSQDQTNLGWTAGGGIEVGFGQNWSAKTEYLYYDLGNQNYVLNRTDNGFSASLLRFGINYRF